jgi:hypothetical protein
MSLANASPAGRSHQRLNGKLILQLSLLGLAMAIATVFVIPSNIEPLFWLAIFIFCAYVIARKAPGRYFVHGFLTSLMNCVWITGTHALFYDQYIANHAEEAQMMAQLNFPTSPRLMMALTGPIIGIVSGVVLGVFAVIAAMVTSKERKAAA